MSNTTISLFDSGLGFDLLNPPPKARKAKAPPAAKQGKDAVRPPPKRLAHHRGVPRAYIHLIRIHSCDSCGEEMQTCEGEFVEFWRETQTLAQWIAVESLSDSEAVNILSSIPERVEYHHTNVAECPACIYLRHAADGREVVPTTCKQGDLFHASI